MGNRMTTESLNSSAERLSEPCLGMAGFSANASAQQGARIEEAERFLELAADFRMEGRAEKARRYARRAHAIFERESGADPRDTVRALICLAGAREDLADHARAEADYRRAGDVLDRLESADEFDVPMLRIETMRGLASVMLARDQDCRALTMLRQALAIAQQTFGSTSSEVATVLDDLGVLNRHTGWYEEAWCLHHQALAITEKELGPGHPQAGTILHHLGILECARGRFAEGEPFARRAADIRRKTLGPDHPQVAVALASVAALLEGQGRYVEAKALDQCARTIRERWFGLSHDEGVGTPGPLAATAAR
jgi:tetratricopeptide (TPR) repeat protein